MDAQASPHPTPETLRAYALGAINDASAAIVREHLEHCSDCRRQVAEIEPDGFVDRLRQPAEGSGMPAVEQPLAAGPLTGSPVADGVTVDSSDRPCMSETGLVDATSAVQNGPNASPLPAGTLVGYFGDYELQNVLGEGGMGIVYKARQLSLNRLVALKMIKAARFASADEIRRFQNVSEAVARLDHPNIVPIFEVGQLEDQHYFSMKLIAGASLDRRPRDYMAKPKQAAELMSITAGAVHHAHQRGILHRDLKPANILIDAERRPHVTDFGLAKRVEGDSGLTQTGAILGTPAYMAPEQASGKRGAVTTATDVYGLGAVLYVLLTGKAPFGGDSVIDTLEQVRERPAEPPSKRNARVPHDLEAICLKCLEKDPRRRYRSADALAEDLRCWLAGEPIAARPVGNAARFWMWCRRNPVAAVAATLVTTAIVAVAVLSLLYAAQQTRLVETTTLYANEQRQRGDERAEAAAKISGLNNNLEISLADTNRRLAMLYFERAKRAFEGNQASDGLVWLVETWRAAALAQDHAWQRLARMNLSYWRYHCPELRGLLSHEGPVSYVAFGPDGKTILSVTRGVTAQVWDPDTCEPIGRAIRNENAITSAVYSPDGKLIIIASGRSARLWQTSSAQSVGPPMMHQQSVSSVAFSPDGHTVVTGGSDGARLWDAAAARPLGQLGSSYVNLVAYSADGKTIFTAGGNEVQRWNAASTRTRRLLSQSVHLCSMSFRSIAWRTDPMAKAS